MSSDFYFNKWKDTLKKLEEMVDLDIYYQTSKTHAKTHCEAVQRLSAILSQYMAIYNHVMECLRQNLQVQKVRYIEEVLKAIVARMVALKQELSKLDGSEHLFLSNGLILQKITTNDSELIDIPSKEERPEEVKELIKNATEKANERVRCIGLYDEQEEQSQEEQVDMWKDLTDEEENNENNRHDSYAEKQKVLTEEEMELKRNVEIIQAHERARKTTTEKSQQKNKKEMWVKELQGTVAPKPRLELLERGAAIIQKACRTYFECKRQRYVDCKIDELLGIRKCVKPKNEAQDKMELMQARKLPLRVHFEKQWKTEYDVIKEKYLKQKEDDICDAYRDHIRDWFYMWFEEIKLFHDMPNDKSGGSKLILTGDLPTPDEYLEQYKEYLAAKKSNKGNSALQKKAAKLEAKREALLQQKLEQKNQRMQNELKKKLFKNPGQHPGYEYPESKEETDHILKVIKDYHTDWDEYDVKKQVDVKEKHCVDVDRKNAIMEVKMELIPKVDNDMRIELKKLTAALKKDYINNEETYPEPMKKRKAKKKKKENLTRITKTVSENLATKMEGLVFQGFIKEYPKLKLQDFIGDPNFVGDDVRCNYESALPDNGETRRQWWDICRCMNHGFHRILLVGPRGSGKTVLMHILASLNDAILFELDPSQIPRELISGEYLQQVVLDVVTCARAAQPSVIHIKHVHRLFYKKKKVPPDEKELSLPLFKRYFTKRLFKKILNTDQITIVGSCVDPWMARSAQMLKSFPEVVLMANTSYSVVVQMLNEWVLSNHVLPSDLNVSCLAKVLQGYSFGYLKEFLKRFLNGSRIARISAHGLCPTELYEALLEENVEQVDYENYLKWYSDWTSWGKKEKVHLAEQKEFKQALDAWALKKAKEKTKSGNKL